jgi:hypothetical protein
MRFSAVAAAALSLAAGVSAGYSNVSYTTEIVTAYTTYCPVPTVITHNNVTYTVTEATTLTITNCPCTITKPVVSVATYTSCHVCTTHVAPPPKNVTYETTTTYAVASTAKPTAAATFTGAANKAFAASGAGLAGLVGLAAYIL